MNQLEVKDERGHETGSRNVFILTLTNKGFRLSNYGNEIIDASTVREDGRFTVTKSRAKPVRDNDLVTEYECFLY
jgi:hypothetical protein